MDKTIEYLGAESVEDLEGTPFEGNTVIDWVQYFIDVHGGVGGAHHKAWVLDQCSRILRGTPVHVKIAKWTDGQTEYRVTTGAPSDEYLDYVLAEDEAGYEVDEGIAP